LIARNSARRWLPGGIGLLLLALAQGAAAFKPGEAAGLLQKADSIKTSDPAGFATLLNSLEAQANDLSAAQQEVVHYLKGWKAAYDGEYATAISRLQATIKETHDVTLKFRANASIVNILILGSHYEQAFTQLSELLVLLPRVTDEAAREQGLVVAAQLYNEVGQYDLGMSFAQKLIDENWHGRGVCKGQDLRIRALMKSGRLRAVGPDIMAAIDECSKLNEMGYANFIRTYAATVYMSQNRFEDAIRLLRDHYDEARDTRYRRLISAYESLLAMAYKQEGKAPEARRFATSAVSNSVPNEFTEPLVMAYQLLY
jgi:tetratricopeptide (TPR) repeat protein